MSIFLCIRSYCKPATTFIVCLHLSSVYVDDEIYYLHKNQLQRQNSSMN